MNNSLIENIKNWTISDRWVNGKAGQFKDFDNNGLFRFSETDENCRHYLLSEEDRRKTPVLAIGFVSWLIYHWGEDTDSIFNRYYEMRLGQYKKEHGTSPDALKRNLEKEFYDQNIDKEKKWIKQSEAIFEYITQNEVELIKSFTKNYIEYIFSINYSSFRDLLVCDKKIKSSIIDLIRNTLDASSEKNVTLAIITRALEKKKYILTVQNKSDYHRSICTEFRNAGTISGFNYHYGDNDFDKFKGKEIQAFINKLP
jgi:polyhydroxyalkanoate synthesis regulator protein